MKSTLTRCFVSPLSVWVAWIAICGWNLYQLWRVEMHPAWWSILLLFGLFVVSVFVHAVRVVHAFAKRRERLRTLRTFLLAMMPVTLLGAHISYVYITTYNRLVKVGPLTLSLVPMSIVAGEIEAHLRYPCKTTGERVVMFHHGVENAVEQVAEADAHLARLDEILGRPSTSTIYWIRGPLLGREGYSFCAMAIGSTWENDEVTPMDRHELAHAAISQHLTISSSMPMIIVEGWAEACASEDKDRLWSGAAREAKWTPSLTELTAPPWSYIDFGPIYTQGGAFVDLLLDEFGGEKFLQLYLTCNPDTFDVDCRRVFGVGLDDLQQKFELKRAEWSEGRRVRELLESLPRADDVDGESWQRFLTAYADAIDQSDLLPAYQAESAGSYFIFPNEEYPEGKRREHHARVISSDPVKALVGDEETIVVTHADSFRLSRQDDSQPWKLSKNSSPFPVVYRWISHEEFELMSVGSIGRAFDWYETARWNKHPPVVSALELNSGETGDLCRLVLEYVPELARDEPYTRELTFDRRANWRVVKRVETHPLEPGRIDRRNFRYKFDDEGCLSQVEADSESTDLAGKRQYTHELTLDFSRPPEPDPADYTLAAFGIEEDSREVFPTVPTLTKVLLLLTGMQLMAALAIWRTGRTK